MTNLEKHFKTYLKTELRYKQTELKKLLNKSQLNDDDSNRLIELENRIEWLLDEIG